MQLLGGHTPAAFLAKHWQKKPLLVRQAISNFRGFLRPADLVRLSARTDAVARTVTDTGHAQPAKRWRLQEGPFRKLHAPAGRWTLLVQGIERFHDEGWPLLQRFNFIPMSRIDDLMVSWAKRGGSVGPHTDDYDVFLLQGSGRRRWQIDAGGDLRTVDADVRVLKNFQPTDEWVLEPGDMLYLPPKIGHFGVALDDDCMTWSIGFTMPTAEQLVHNFTAYLAMEANTQRVITDPDLQPQLHPGELSDETMARLSIVLDQLRADPQRLATFAGRLLTGRPGMTYDEPRPPTLAGFAARLQRPGQLRLANNSRMLVRGGTVFLNGDAHLVGDQHRSLWLQLADHRMLSLPIAVDEQTLAVLHHGYGAGHLVLR
jgi:50S ribosomal protein L16 3-hydroxylase